MIVFLDANILYKDPFLTKPYPKKLLEYAKHKLIKIYISKIVKEEMINNYKKQLQVYFSKMKSEEKKLNELLLKKELNSKFDINEEFKIYCDFFDELENNKTIQILDYNNNLLPILIDRAINKKKPFRDKKSEFRDATIWLSIIDFINNENNKNEEYSFITENTEDFFDNEKKELHSDLKKDNNKIKVFSNIENFFADFDKNKKVLTKYKTSSALDYLKSSIHVNDLINIFSNEFLDEFILLFEDWLEVLDPLEINDNYHNSYLSFANEILFSSLNHFNIDTDIFSESLIINGNLEIQGKVNINRYNKNIKQQDTLNTEMIKLTTDFSFNLNLNKQVKNINFKNIIIY